MKRILCIIFSILMCLGLTGPVYADPVDSIESEIRPEQSDLLYGTLVIGFDQPVGWPGYNLIVDLYHNEIGEFYTIYCYNQNGYQAKEKMPAGSYRVDSVSVAGDVLSEYPMLVDKTDFKIIQDSAERIIVQYVGDPFVEMELETEIEDEKEEVIESITESETVIESDPAPETVTEAVENSIVSFIKMNIWFIPPFIILGLVYFFKIYLPRRDTID